MAYTFDYDYIQAVTAFLNDDEVNEDEKDTLVRLAHKILEAAKSDFTLYIDPDIEETA
jgi:hypothetical protein